MRKKLLLAASLAFTVLDVLPVCAQPAPTVAVRAGEHEDFDRVVFDWPHPVKFQLRRDGDRAILTFDAAADLKFTRDIQSHLTRARGFAAHTGKQGEVTVSFTVSPNATLKTFTSNSSIVVDISGNAAKPESPAAAADKQAAPPPPPLGEKEVGVKGNSESTPPAPHPLPPSGEIGNPPASAPQAAPPVSSNAATDSPQPLLPPPLAPQPAPQASPATSKKPEVKTPIADKPAPQPESPIAAAPAAKAVNASNAAAPENVLSNTPTLVAALDPHIKTRAAVYQRAGFGYIVFDRKLTLSPAVLGDGLPAQINLQPLDLPKHSGYRFSVPLNAGIEATLDGTQWKIFLSRKQPSDPVTTSLVAQPDFALGARFLLPLPDAPDPIPLIDPVVGDQLILVPLAQSEAFNAARYTPDLAILPAAQGLVIKPLIDKLIVRAVADGIEITAEGGLALSPSSDTGAATQGAALPLKSLFNFTIWGGKPGETFTQTRQKLQQTIVDVPESERNRARLELARFYFARGNGAEAVALLNFIARQVPDLRAHAEFMALLGAGEILESHPEDGLRDLSSPELAGQPEIGLWQAVGLAQSRDWIHAEEKFAARQNILTGYPEPFFSRFFVLAIESALAAGKDQEAADWLDNITKAPHSPAIEPALSYLRGVLHAKAGRAAAAEDAWKEAGASNDQLYKIRAELALIDLDVSTSSLSPAQAADRLEALRFGWRGDDLEVDILHRLGQFYIQAKNVKAGLGALSQAITLYPSSPQAPAIRAEMASVFHDVFLGDLGKKLSPIDTLTLYQQYRDLMPTGKDGDVLMRNMAERLIAVDLLDQASSVLEDLVKNRLQGEDKDKAALRLAAIRLLDRKPADAVSALDLIGKDVLSPAMQNERTLLHARALAGLNRDDEATALLKDNASPGAKMLRADIAMHAQKWGDAATALMELVGPPPPNGTALTPDQASDLINAAIAYAMNNDQTGLDKLAIDYGAAMTGTPRNDTFLMLTQPEKTGQLRDLAAVQTQISQVDTFQNFLNTYRKAETSDETTEKKP
ncbi:MAG: hypothetical protein P4M13_07950 [Alphaproteobacteria bacterium]|nr:hypothetical protein [Alphaproteobacteria bacterium]